MGKRWRVIIIIFASTALVAGAAWQVMRPREPVFEGKPLSFWLKGYDPIQRTEPGEQKADEVVGEIGTNAIPTLLRMLSTGDPPFIVKLKALARRQHFITFRRRAAANQHFQAVKAFQRLGPSAKTAVPALIEIYEQNISAVSQIETARALGSIGPPAGAAVPALLRGMTNVDANVRRETAFVLSQIRAEPALVVPVLTNSLHDPVPAVRTAAINALGMFGKDAKSAAPSLLPLLNDPDSFTRHETARILKLIDPRAAPSNGEITGPAK
jgi:HEAT repeat protein